MQTKNINFNFYQISNDIDREKIEEMIRSLGNNPKNKLEVKELQKIKNTQYNTGFKCKEFLDYIKGKEKIEIDLPFKKIEIDLNSYLVDSKDNKYVFFQVSNCRETNFPNKKRIGKPREEIKIEDDEYLSEFSSILLNIDLNVMMFQINKYAVSISNLEKCLSIIYCDFLKYKGVDHADLMCIKLRPLLKELNAKEKRKNNKYVSVEIQANNSNISMLEKHSSFSDLTKMYKKIKSTTLKVSFKVNSKTVTKEKDNALDEQDIEKLWDIYSSYLDDNKPNIRVKTKDLDTNKIEELDWFIPILKTKISFSVNDRQSIGYEYMNDKMKKEFQNKINTIYKIVGERKSKSD